MAEYFVDTTVLTDVLIKTTVNAQSAKKKLKAADASHLPVYAIKEFKAGPLHALVYAHNKLLDLGSFSAFLTALNGLVRSPRKYLPATILEALAEASKAAGELTSADLVKRYGPTAEKDVFLADDYRIQIRLQIKRAWRKRRRITTDVVCPLSCYSESEPTENASGMLEDDPKTCSPPRECCMGPEFRARPADIRALLEALRKQPNSRETVARRKALKLLRNNRELDEASCRALGDAVFALKAPPSSVILSTNLRDQEPLATALGKRVERP